MRTTPRLTKIIATIGPAQDKKDKLCALIQAGVDVIRINASHVSADKIDSITMRIRQCSVIVGRQIAILLDLPGPKIRIGALAKPVISSGIVKKSLEYQLSGLPKAEK